MKKKFFFLLKCVQSIHITETFHKFRSSNMDVVELETRLIHLNSRQANTFESSTNFECTMGAAPVEIREKLSGVSLESVSFLNVVPNLWGANPNTRTLILENQLAQRLLITFPISFFSIEKIAAYIQAAIDADINFAPLLQVSVAEGAGDDGGDRLLFENIGGLDITIEYDASINPQPHVAPYVLGIYEETVLPAGQSLLTRTNLQGPGIVYLKSDALTASKHSVNGFARADHFIASIPYGDTEYGAMVAYSPNQNERPGVVYGLTEGFELSSIDIQLVLADGQVVDLGNAPIYITLRAWLRNQ